MYTIGEILRFLSGKAPTETAQSFDNVGLLAGDSRRPVRSVLLSLDITLPVIREAEALGADLIVSHHPLFFSLKAANEQSSSGLRTLELLSRGIDPNCTAMQAIGYKESALYLKGELSYEETVEAILDLVRAVMAKEALHV